MGKKQTKSVAVAQPNPKDYMIPQTVTSPAERRKIRNFLQMRQNQIKARLDRIYKFQKKIRTS